jgi:hypothetical protein
LLLLLLLSCVLLFNCSGATLLWLEEWFCNGTHQTQIWYQCALDDLDQICHNRNQFQSVASHNKVASEKLRRIHTAYTVLLFVYIYYKKINSVENLVLRSRKKIFF